MSALPPGHFHYNKERRKDVRILSFSAFM